MNAEPQLLTSVEWIRRTLVQLEKVEPLIMSALSHGADTHDFDDICHGVLSGRLILEVLPNSVFVLEIIEYPKGRFLHGFLAAGDLAELMARVPELEQRAKDAGFIGVSIAGRRGWKKPFEQIGWHAGAFIMEKDLRNG